MQSHLILYVKDQDHSTGFYAAVLAMAPRLHVPGMTEFALGNGSILGLMPIDGIRRLLGPSLPDPARADGIPRAELYLLVDDAQAYHGRALACGAREMSPMLERNWGHRAAYSMDPDGHILAFAQNGGP